MISIKELAAYCNVSVATVSKALHDKSDIGDETRQKVRKAAQSLGYIPDEAAITLRTGHSRTIGLLFAGEKGKALTDEFFPHIVNAIKNAAEVRGYEILFIHKTQDKDNISYLEHCRYRKVDGVIMGYLHYEDTEVKELLDSALPIVTIDFCSDVKTSVCFDYEQGMRDLVSYVCEMGHTKVAYITGQDSRITRERVGGFNQEMKERGLTVPEEYVKQGNYLSSQKAAELTEELLDLPVPPTCILYPNDFSALGGVGAIAARRLSVPEDISIAGYDGIPVADAMRPRLTTLVQNTEKMGEIAVQKLMDQIKKPDKQVVEKIQVEGVVNTGGTVKRIM